MTSYWIFRNENCELYFSITNIFQNTIFFENSGDIQKSVIKIFKNNYAINKISFWEEIQLI